MLRAVATQQPPRAEERCSAWSTMPGSEVDRQASVARRFAPRDQTLADSELLPPAGQAMNWWARAKVLNSRTHAEVVNLTALRAAGYLLFWWRSL
jgi:hypothetical protein